MAKLRVGLLFGGRSVEHEVSLASAASILGALDPSRYEVRLLCVDHDGRWHLAAPGALPESAAQGPEVSLPAVPGARLADISGAVEDVAVARGYGIIRQFVGHGIGTEMHQDPQIPNYRTGSRGVELQPGMCLAIEPMFTLGDGDVHVLPDGWTVVTSDGTLSAHFEHTIAVTDDGPQVLTTIQ